VSCSAGAVVPADTKFAIGTVTYNDPNDPNFDPKVPPYTATFTVNGNLPLSNGTYRLYICGTTSIVDPVNTALGLVGVPGQPNSDFRRNFTVDIAGAGGGDGTGSSTGTTGGGANGGGSKKDTSSQIIRSLLIPVTGFAPDQITLLPVQPEDKAYQSLEDIRIEIPTLGINFPIVGVSLSKATWDLTWLKGDVGYLEGSAFPTYNGNTVLTAHVIDANNNLGPFSDIKGMQVNDKIYIHAYGKIYIYQVQENVKLLPENTSTVFKHEEYSWVTLVTCEDYNAKTKLYKYRRMVRAILISVVTVK
jgi:LPXTG-site transpeptidase (sortase) family protein